MAAPNSNPWKEDTLPLSQKELTGRAQGNSRGSSSINSSPLWTEVNYCGPSSSSTNYDVEEGIPPENENSNITGSTRYDTPYTTGFPATSGLPQAQIPYISRPRVEDPHRVLLSTDPGPRTNLSYVSNMPQGPIHMTIANTFSQGHSQNPQYPDLIRQLSELSDHLSEQLKNIKTENWTHCLSSLFDTNFSPESEGDRTLLAIHSSSEYFLKLISQLKESRSGNPTTPTQESFQPPTQFETSPIPLLITCYLRSINIYHAIFSQIHRYLLSTNPYTSSSTFSRTSPPGHSPQSYGKLQATIFIEVSIQIINRFDIAIGIPAQHRLTPNTEFGGGVLEDEALLEVVLRRTAEEGDGGMRALEEVIGSIKGLLGWAEVGRVPFSVDID